MAVVNTKSTYITAADATPTTKVNRAIVKMYPEVTRGKAAVASVDDNGSTYRLVRLPSNAVLNSIKLTITAMTGATDYDLGIYETAANGGAAVNATLFVDSQDVNAGIANQESLFSNNAITNLEKTLWELLGLTSDPGKSYDLVVTANAVGSAAGTIAAIVEYSV